jgi:hypothetical protein
MLGEPERSQLPDDPIPTHALIGHDGGAPIFFGHYWLNGNPLHLLEKAACVDYSVAKGGNLVAYRWDGEPVLDANQFHWFGR